MKIPKVFVGEGTEVKIKKREKEVYNLEDFVYKEIRGYKKSSVFDIDMGMETGNTGFLHGRGIEPKSVEKAVFVHYNNNTIMLIKHNRPEDITKDLRKLFKKGTLFYEKNSSITEFTEIFLFKNNIAVYLQGKDDFNKKAADYYRRKGFKQLGYELKEV